MRTYAYAKINLGLDVVGKREDGYHELDMIMVPINLCDIIDIELSEFDELICNHKQLALDESNTIIKAVRLMRDTYHVHDHFSIRLEKNIPMEAGLAGGSADAAAVMRAINDLLALNIPLEELSMLSKKIGADVPFCILNTCAEVKGIGEQITPFKADCDFYILLVKPKSGVPTGKAFQMLEDKLYPHPNCIKIKEAFINNDFIGLCKSLGNSLESSAFEIVRDLFDIKKELKDYGFEGVLMSGSGSTMFAITQDKERLKAAKQQLEKKYQFVKETTIYKKESEAQ